MPEGPECRYIAHSLNLLCQECVVQSMNIYSGRYSRHGPPEGWEQFQAEIQKQPVKITSIQSHGKFIYWKFSNDWYLWNTLGMSGQWTIQGESQDPHLHIGIQVLTPIGKPQTLWWRDIRNFGSLKFVQGEEKLQQKISKLGVDILSPTPLGTEEWLQLAHRYDGYPLPKFLMDQRILAGVGNYLKSEALYMANISPFRTVGDLADSELTLLYQSIRDIAIHSFQSNGASFSTYAGPKLEKGLYGFEFKIYGKQFDPYGHEVLRYTSEDGRTTHWVKETQT